jgi:hypothetical protein
MGIGFGPRPRYAAWNQAISTYLSLPGNFIEYTMSGTPSGATYNISGLFTWTPTSGQIGAYPVTITATSGVDSYSRNETFEVVQGYTAHSFDGGDYANCGNVNIANSTRDTMTLALWWKHDQSAAGGSVIIGKGRAADNNLEWQFRVKDTTSDKMEFVMSDSGNIETVQFELPKEVTNNSWHHWVFAFQSGTMNVYRDCIPQSGTITSGAWPSSFYSGSADLVIGAATAAPLNATKGSITLVTAYSGILSSGDIYNLYLGTYPGNETFKLRRSTAAVSGLWYDESVNAFNARLGIVAGSYPALVGHYTYPPFPNETTIRQYY